MAGSNTRIARVRCVPDRTVGTAALILREYVTHRAVIPRLWLHLAMGIVLLASPAWAGAAQAQEPPAAQKPVPPEELPSALAPVSGQTTQNPAAPCIQPAPLVSWRDYQGPFAKTVGIFGRKLERRSVRSPHYKPGAALCTLEVKDKFILFVQDTLDPVTFLSVGYDSGISQAENHDPSFGQGAAGYGKRFGANFAGQASSAFFKDFAYPTIFLEDPRYYRLAQGGTGRRLFHAASHSVIAYRETNGSRMFNFTEWLGTASAVALSNVYHPDNRRGFAPAAERVGTGVGYDIGFDALREFWPEIAHKFKLPFRDEQDPASSGASAPGQVSPNQQRQ